MKNIRIIWLMISLFSIFNVHAYACTADTDSIYMDLFEILKSQNEIPEEYYQSDMEDIRFMVYVKNINNDEKGLNVNLPFGLYKVSYIGSSSPKEYYLVQYKKKFTMYFLEENLYEVVLELLEINRKDPIILSDKLLIDCLNKLKRRFEYKYGLAHKTGRVLFLIPKLPDWHQYYLP